MTVWWFAPMGALADILQGLFSLVAEEVVKLDPGSTACWVGAGCWVLDSILLDCWLPHI